MTTRPKAFLKQAKAKSKKEQKLETADDYQAAGVDFEDAAGKWRAGDPVKSMRFFQRAIEVYTQGLQRHPNSFDLAYNKARVELEVATHPILVKQLEVSVLTQLQLTLLSHRLALSLDHENADALFNTSQVLTSIAEEITKSEETNAADALHLLEEALDLQSRCLQIQEVKYQEQLQLQQHIDKPSTPTGNSSDQDEGGARIESDDDKQEDQWFSIEEPVTVDTLIDSILAQLNTLTTLCGVVSSSPESAPTTVLPWAEKISSNSLTIKLPHLVDGSSTRIHEIALIKANLMSSMLEAGFRTGTVDIDTYKRERDTAFTTAPLNQGDDIETFIANARSLLSFNSALADSPEQSAAFTGAQWTALTTAIAQLTKASKIKGASPDDQAKTHLLRGDASLLQFIMGQEPTNYPAAVSNAAQLLKNAEVFYRNASKLATDSDEKSTAALRSAVASYLSNGDRSSIVPVVQSRGEAWVSVQIEDMSIEGLISVDFTL